MGLRKANAYSKRKVVPFTRFSKKRTKSFIKTVPPQKIVKFEMGRSDLLALGKLPHIVEVSSTEDVQIRHNAFEACSKIGYPECDVILGEIVLYLALAPKSNRVYEAIHKTKEVLEENPDAPVPLFLRNAPTKLMKQIGYGKDYIYPPHAKNGFVSTNYLPQNLQGKELYCPSEQGKEKQFKQRLHTLRKRLNRNENN